jgi:hypothetical protein
MLKLDKPIGQHHMAHANNGRVVHGKGFFDNVGNFVAQRAASAAKGALRGGLEGAISGNGRRRKKR